MANGSCCEPRLGAVVLGMVGAIVVVAGVVVVVSTVVDAGRVVVALSTVVVVALAVRLFASDFRGFVAAEAGNASSVAAMIADRSRFIGGP